MLRGRVHQFDDHSVSADGGATLPGKNGGPCGRNRRRAGAVKPLKGHAEVWRGRVQRQFHPGPGHESYSVTSDRASERMLGATGALWQRRQVVSGVGRHARLCQAEVVRNGHDADHPVSFTE